MTKRWTEIGYKCRCLSAERTVRVVERGTTEDVLDFMDRVRTAIASDHVGRSPECSAQTMEYAKIRVENNVIGGTAGGTA